MPTLEWLNREAVFAAPNSGYAGLDNEHFYMGKTMMVFGDAK